MKSLIIVIMVLTIVSLIGSIGKENLSAFIGYLLALTFEGLLLVSVIEGEKKNGC